MENDSRLLMLIDDEPAQRRLITALVGREGWRTLVVPDGETAIATLGTRQGMQLSAIIVDQLHNDDAASLISELRLRRPALPILMITASESPLLAVDAMRAGATDYLIKPVFPDRLLQALRSAVRTEAPRKELQPLTEKMAPTLDFDEMIGASPNFRSELAKAAKAARGHGHMLIEGESGTGKEMLIRSIQAASPRAKMPFRYINARSLQPSAIESVLFGHEQNAFPGAFDRKSGALQSCDGGTLAIDEIDRLPSELQAKLAEVLATKIVRPVGAQHGYKIDVRILAAANMPLHPVHGSAHFHPDLLAQVNHTRVTLPPLRERQNDIAALTRHFLSRIGEQPGLRPVTISDAALGLLSNYEWPGNVRQLQAVLFRAAVFCDGNTLTAEHFPQLTEMFGEPATAHHKSPTESAGVMIYGPDGNLRALEDIEADVIRLAIGHYRGRMTEVARRLGIGRSTLYRKLSDLGIDSAA